MDEKEPGEMPLSDFDALDLEALDNLGRALDGSVLDEVLKRAAAQRAERARGPLADPVTDPHGGGSWDQFRLF